MICSFHNVDTFFKRDIHLTTKDCKNVVFTLIGKKREINCPKQAMGVAEQTNPRE